MNDPEARVGILSSLVVLSAIHKALRPRLYLEIGIETGRSLSLARCNSIGVDPKFSVTFELSAPTSIYKTTSDDFFHERADKVLSSPIDFAFIDGQHWFEFALRDFMNIERYSNQYSVVVFDDIFPNHPLQAARDRQTRNWTGDVWKIVPCLRQYRPDLTLIQLDTIPTGLLVVLGLSPDNRVLSDSYSELLRTYISGDEITVPASVLERSEALHPFHDGLFASLSRFQGER